MDPAPTNGTARKESDHDLLIVWRDENPPRARAATVRQALLDLGFPMDVAVMTPPMVRTRMQSSSAQPPVPGKPGGTSSRLRSSASDIIS
jgi:hypothetical protein